MFNNAPNAAVFGMDANHLRHQAYCCNCNTPWGNCNCTGVYPINRQNQRLMLEQQLMRGGGYYSGGQPMYCGGCRGVWGGCTCVNVQPICGMGNPLQFEGMMLEEIGIIEGDPMLAAEGAMLSGQGFMGVAEAVVEAEIFRAFEDGDGFF